MSIDRIAQVKSSTGVVLVNGQGAIERLNSQAESLLGVTQEQAVGRSITDLLAGYTTDTTLQSLIRRFGHTPADRIAGKAIPSTSVLSVNCSALPDGSGQEAWIISLKKTNRRTLSSALRAMRSAREKIGKRQIVIAGVILTLAATANFFTTRSAHPDQAPPQPPGALTPIGLKAGVTGAPQTTDSILSLVGVIEAGQTFSVTAPFDAVIKEKNFSFDTDVSQGQLLLLLDTSELLTRLQEARVAMLKAANALREVENWEKGAEVARAQRSSVLAQQQVEQTERKVNEAEILLKKGIIPRSEYDGLVEQLNGYKSQSATTQDDLKATREKANKSNREIARIEYTQAQAKYKELSDRLALEKIVAPHAGIITRVPATSSQASATLEVGSRIAKGQLLFNIATTDKLWISAKVDEADIVDLTPSMRAVVSIDSQDMPAIEGRLVGISAQAAQNGGISRSATFDIKIEIPELDAQQRRRLRVGMSCNVNIEKNPRSAVPADGNPTR